jgi:hypothetical protein
LIRKSPMASPQGNKVVLVVVAKLLEGLPVGLELGRAWIHYAAVVSPGSGDSAAMVVNVAGEPDGKGDMVADGKNDGTVRRRPSPALLIPGGPTVLPSTTARPSSPAWSRSSMAPIIPLRNQSDSKKLDCRPLYTEREFHRGPGWLPFTISST